jgi:Ribbon-helix-helix protein, copG family.
MRDEINGTTRISVRIPKQLKKYLEEIAKKNRMTLSEFIRNALIWFQMCVITNSIEIPNFKKINRNTNIYMKKGRRM